MVSECECTRQGPGVQGWHAPRGQDGEAFTVGCQHINVSRAGVTRHRETQAVHDTVGQTLHGCQLVQVLQDHDHKPFNIVQVCTVSGEEVRTRTVASHPRHSPCPPCTSRWRGGVWKLQTGSYAVSRCTGHRSSAEPHQQWHAPWWDNLVVEHQTEVAHALDRGVHGDSLAVEAPILGRSERDAERAAAEGFDVSGVWVHLQGDRGRAHDCGRSEMHGVV